MIDFFIKVQQHLQLNLPFVLYSKPNENRVVGLFQKDNELNFAESFTEKGFVFAPFDGEQIILIPDENSEVFEVVFVHLAYCFYLSNVTSAKHVLFEIHILASTQNDKVLASHYSSFVASFQSWL